MPARGPDRSWSATICCTCGWEGEVGDHPDEASALVGARAVWILHCFDVPAPAYTGPSVPDRELVASDVLDS